MSWSMESQHNDIAHMREAVLFEGRSRQQKLNRFWILLVLSSVIAAAGVVADSTATVIGAMIVAPMMLPIQGTMLSTVLADRRNLIRSIVLVIAGAAVSIAIGFALGLLVVNDVVAATNSQVAGRVSPRLIDLLAALGTGAVGSIALVRRDISDTLPGVAIAISLVPPLAVVGLTLESGAVDQSLGALLLFVTNVTAILATGIVVMAIYRVYRGTAKGASEPVNRARAVLIIGGMLLVVGIPLTVTSITTGANAVRESAVQSAATTWVNEIDWDLLGVATEGDRVVVRVTGPTPLPDTDRFAELLEADGVPATSVKVELVPSHVVELK